MIRLGILGATALSLSLAVATPALAQHARGGGMRGGSAMHVGGGGMGGGMRVGGGADSAALKRALAPNASEARVLRI